MNAAPWSAAVKAASTFSVALLVALAVGLPFAFSNASNPPFADGMRALVRLLPIAILVIAALFMVRGYEIEGRELLVQRLLWATRVPIDGLESAWLDPEAMAGSIRVFGNSGFLTLTVR